MEEELGVHLSRGTRRFRVLVLITALGAALAVPATAQASGVSAERASVTANVALPASMSQCPNHSLCLWHDSGFAGTLWVRTYGNVSSNTWLWLGSSSFNDQASSLYNKREYSSGVDKNYPANSPDSYCFDGGVSFNNLANVPWPDGTTMNDSISSYYLSSTTTGCRIP
jgi:Peptidase inhibitor family I36